MGISWLENEVGNGQCLKPRREVEYRQCIWVDLSIAFFAA